MASDSEGTSSGSIGSWLATLAFVAAIAMGIVLFFVPEPITSVLGAILIVVATLIRLGTDIGGD